MCQHGWQLGGLKKRKVWVWFVSAAALVLVDCHAMSATWHSNAALCVHGMVTAVAILAARRDRTALVFLPCACHPDCRRVFALSRECEGFSVMALLFS